MKRRRFLRLSLSGLGTGCVTSLKNFPFDELAKTPPKLGIEIAFYGVSCFSIRWGDVQILTDPFFTYLPFLQVAFGKVLPEPEQVDPYMGELQDVQAMLIGHAHYDHILDLPYIASALDENCFVLGSKTLGHIFAPSQLPTPFVSVNDIVTTSEKQGQWWIHPNKRFRALPILSDHPMQYLFFHLYKKTLSKDRKTPPSKVNHYQEGITFAFLLDFLDEEEKPVRRILIQTSSTGLPMGGFPKEILDEKSIDVALLAMDCANQDMKGEVSVVDEYPAPHTFFCHYENFFRPKDADPTEIVKVDLEASKEFFIDQPDRRFYFPKIDSRFLL